MTFRRGFKTWCENFAVSLREDLGLDKIGPLDPRLVAHHLGILVLRPDDIPGIPEESRRVLIQETQDWSAVTVNYGNDTAVIYNPSHSDGRNSSDLMHEFAHVILDHRPAKIVLSSDAAIALRTFDRSQEEEASWLSGCLLLPRPALVKIAKNMDPESACDLYRVSDELLTYRTNITGVTAQMRYRRRGSRQYSA